jgi:hypothetical protein
MTTKDKKLLTTLVMWHKLLLGKGRKVLTIPGVHREKDF